MSTESKLCDDVLKGANWNNIEQVYTRMIAVKISKFAKGAERHVGGACTSKYHARRGEAVEFKVMGRNFSSHGTDVACEENDHASQAAINLELTERKKSDDHGKTFLGVP